MSGTRSHSRKVPATEALIVAHGQPSDPAPAEAEVAQLAFKVAARLPGRRIQGVTLAASGSLERALAASNAPPMIYPLFMSDGWFTGKALPRRLNGSAGRILAPLGLDTALVGLAAETIAAKCLERDWPLGQVTLTIAGHGSGFSHNAAPATRAFSVQLSHMIALRDIRIGFVEEPPSIAEAASGAGPMSICLRFFAASGRHVQDDVPNELAKARCTGETLTAIGASSRIPMLVANALANADVEALSAPLSG